MSLILGARITSATGGTISSITGYTVHTFTTSGTFTANTPGFIEVLVVGGGGGAFGGNIAYGGGGGGGSVIYSKFVPVSAGVGYTVTIGSGGLGGGPISSGGSTQLFYGPGPVASPTNVITASGGGYGNGGSSPQGSGGGGSGTGTFPAVTNGTTGGTGAGVIGLGFPGGSSNIFALPAAAGGGGGGAGGAGNSSGVVYPVSTNQPGGPGLTYSITGSSVSYGSGGVGLYNNGIGIAPNGAYGAGGSGSYPTGTLPYCYGTQGAVIIRYIS